MQVKYYLLSSLLRVNSPEQYCRPLAFGMYRSYYGFNCRADRITVKCDKMYLCLIVHIMTEWSLQLWYAFNCHSLRCRRGSGFVVYGSALSLVSVGALVLWYMEVHCPSCCKGYRVCGSDLGALTFEFTRALGLWYDVYPLFAWTDGAGQSGHLSKRINFSKLFVTPG